MADALAREAGSRRGAWLPGPLVRAAGLLVLVAVLAAGGVSAWLVARVSEPQALQRILEQDGGEVEMLARMLSSKVELNFKTLAVVAEGLSPAVIGSNARLRAWLLQSRPAARLFDAVTVLRSEEAEGLQLQGGEVAAVDRVEDAEQALVRRVWRERKPMVSGVLGSRPSQARVALALPVLGSSGQTVAVVAATLRLQSQNLLPPALALPERESTRFMVFTQEGVILSHPDASRVLGLVRDEPGLANVFSGGDGAAQLLAQPGRTVLPDGSVVGWAVAGLPGWVVARVNRAPSLLQPLMAAEQRVWWLAGAAVAVVALLALLALWWLTRPLTLLRQRARAVLAGEHPASVPWQQNHLGVGGEVDDVVRVFARLVQLRRQQQRTAQALEYQLQAVLEHVPLGIALTRSQRIEVASSQACRLFGYTPAQLVGRDLLQLVSGSPEGGELAERVRVDFAVHGRFHGELPLTRRDGGTFWAQVHGEPVRAGDPAAGVIWVIEDGSAEREARLQHDWERWHDALTFLPNRAALVRRLQLLLSSRKARGARASAHEPPAAGVLMHVDVDHFTLVNELAGHDAGDDALRHLARLLESHVRQMGWLARLGGDEFAVVLPGCGAERGAELAEKLRAAVAAWEPTYRGRSFALSLSIGLVALSVGGGTAEALAGADMACYAAKRAGRNRVEWGLVPQPASAA